MLSSEELAVQMKDVKLSGKSSACFLIGSSFGISQKIKQLADFKLSMSKMTFPHQLMRVILLEQIRTIDKRRLREHMGKLDDQHMHMVDEAIAVSFGLQENRNIL